MHAFIPAKQPSMNSELYPKGAERRGEQDKLNIDLDYRISGRADIVLARDSLEEPWGFALESGHNEESPLIVQRVFPGSLADKQQLMRGDVITAVDGNDLAYLRHSESVELMKLAQFELTLTISPQPSQPIPTATFSESVPQTSALISSQPLLCNTEPTANQHNFTRSPKLSQQVVGAPCDANSVQSAGRVNVPATAAQPVREQHQPSETLIETQPEDDEEEQDWSHIARPYWATTGKQSVRRNRSDTDSSNRSKSAGPYASSGRRMYNKTTVQTYSANISEPGWAPKTSPLSNNSRSVSQSAITGKGWTPRHKPQAPVYQSMTEMGWTPKSKSNLKFTQHHGSNPSLTEMELTPKIQSAAQSRSTIDVSTRLGESADDEEEYRRCQTARTQQGQHNNQFSTLPSRASKKWIPNKGVEEQTGTPAWYGSLRSSGGRHRAAASHSDEQWKPHGDDKETQWIQCQTAANLRAQPKASYKTANPTNYIDKPYHDVPSYTNEVNDSESTANYKKCWTSTPNQKQYDVKDNRHGKERFRSEIQNIHLVTTTWITPRDGQDKTQQTKEYEQQSVYKGPIGQKPGPPPTLPKPQSHKAQGFNEPQGIASLQDKVSKTPQQHVQLSWNRPSQELPPAGKIQEVPPAQVINQATVQPLLRQSEGQQHIELSADHAVTSIEAIKPVTPIFADKDLLEAKNNTVSKRYETPLNVNAESVAVSRELARRLIEADVKMIQPENTIIRVAKTSNASNQFSCFNDFYVIDPLNSHSRENSSFIQPNIKRSPTLAEKNTKIERNEMRQFSSCFSDFYVVSPASAAEPQQGGSGYYMKPKHQEYSKDYSQEVRTAKETCSQRQFSACFADFYVMTPTNQPAYHDADKLQQDVVIKQNASAIKNTGNEHSSFRDFAVCFSDFYVLVPDDQVSFKKSEDHKVELKKAGESGLQNKKAEQMMEAKLELQKSAEEKSESKESNKTNDDILKPDPNKVLADKVKPIKYEETPKKEEINANKNANSPSNSTMTSNESKRDLDKTKTPQTKLNEDSVKNREPVKVNSAKQADSHQDDNHKPANINKQTLIQQNKQAVDAKVLNESLSDNTKDTITDTTLASSNNTFKTKKLTTPATFLSQDKPGKPTPGKLKPK